MLNLVLKIVGFNFFEILNNSYILFNIFYINVE
jgi:hypothetical protein